MDKTAIRIIELPATMSACRFIMEMKCEGWPDADVARLFMAMQFAITRHWGETRYDKETRYVEHLLVVAYGAYKLGLTVDEIIAALLHDVRENHGVSIKEIRKLFGDVVANIVEALSKDPNDEDGIFDQIYLATITIFAIIFIKLIDRWHNLETTYGFRDISKQIRFLEETLGPLRALTERCRRLIPPEYLREYDWLVQAVMELAEVKYKRIASIAIDQAAQD